MPVTNLSIDFEMWTDVQVSKHLSILVQSISNAHEMVSNTSYVAVHNNLTSQEKIIYGKQSFR